MRPLAVVAALLIASTAGAAGFRASASLGPSGFRVPSGDGIVFRASFATTGCLASPVADTGQAITVTRASTRTCGSSLATCQNNELCVESDGALVEPGRTNLIVFSQAFDNAEWALFNAPTVTADAAVAPDGTTTADQVNAGSAAIRDQGIAVAASTAYQFTVWLKRATGSNQTVPIYVFNDSSASVLGTNNATATDTWQRFTLSVTTPVGATTVQAGFNVGSYNVYAWGAQLEAGDAPTTYIATAGTAAARANDAISFPINVPDSEGCVRADVKLLASAFAGTARVLGLAVAPSMLYVSTDTQASANDGTNTVSQAASSISAASRSLRSSWSGSTLLVQTASGSTSGSYDGAFGLGLPVTVYLGSQNGSSNFLGGYVKNIKIGTRASRCDL